jgi:hypothetical protein
LNCLGLLQAGLEITLASSACCFLLLQVTNATDAVSYTAGTREAALHALAGRHPHIVPLLDAFEHRTAAGRHACMVME